MESFLIFAKRRSIVQHFCLRPNFFLKNFYKYSKILSISSVRISSKNWLESPHIGLVISPQFNAFKRVFFKQNVCFMVFYSTEEIDGNKLDSSVCISFRRENRLWQQDDNIKVFIYNAICIPIVKTTF